MTKSKKIEDINFMFLVGWPILAVYALIAWIFIGIAFPDFFNKYLMFNFISDYCYQTGEWLNPVEVCK